MEQAMTHLFYNAGLNLSVERGHGEISRCSHDVKGSLEVIRAVRKGERSSVNESEGEVERRWSERWRGECKC